MTPEEMKDNFPDGLKKLTMALIAGSSFSSDLLRYKDKVDLQAVLTQLINSSLLRPIFNQLLSSVKNEKEYQGLLAKIGQMIEKKFEENFLKTNQEFWTKNATEQKRIVEEIAREMSHDLTRMLADFEKTKAEKPSLNAMTVGQVVAFLNDMFKKAKPQEIKHESGAISRLTITIDPSTINESENSFAVNVSLVSNEQLQLQGHQLVAGVPAETPREHVFQFKLTKDGDNNRLVVGLGEHDHKKVNRFAELAARLKLINHAVHALTGSTAESATGVKEVQLKNGEEKVEVLHATAHKAPVAHAAHDFSHEEHAEFHDLVHHVHGMKMAADNVVNQVKQGMNVEVVLPDKLEIVSSFFSNLSENQNLQLPKRRKASTPAVGPVISTCLSPAKAPSSGDSSAPTSV